MKTKNFFIATTALVVLASCSGSDFVGDKEALNAARDNGAISFGSSTPSMTRASGEAAASSLNKNFVVLGYKTVSSTPSTVFDNYQVNWVTNTAGTTTTNSANWEYVGYKNLPTGVGTNTGVTAFAETTEGDPNNSSAIEQSIKYWDFSASAYDFFAYSLGTGSGSTWAKASALSINPNTYTLEGTAEQLGTVYISNIKNVVPSTSSTEVDLEFRSFLSKIELRFYETIPGYSVKSVTFYPSADGTPNGTPYLYASGEAFPTGGKYIVTFDENGKAQLELKTSEPVPTKDTKTTAFETTLTNYKDKEYREASGSYLGRSSNDATKTNTITMLPNPQNTNALNIKMDFTLVSRDGSGEEINMKGATAVVPAEYAKWLPNYKYTYVFKISDNTNAKTASITGLYPITLDAVVTDDVDGTQETITTVDDPSITTYAKGSSVTTNNEYLTGANIYIVVDDGTNITANTDAKLYAATITPESGATPRPAAQGVTEATVANALKNGTEDPTGTWSVTDANGATLAVTKVDGLTDFTEIAAADAPNGKAITVDGVKFTPASAGYYVFEYHTSANVYYTPAEVNKYNAGLPGAIKTSDVAYSFTSYADSEGNTQHGSGKVKQVSQEGGWTTVLITSNTPIDAYAPSFVGQQFKVNETSLNSETYYQLYPLEGDALPIYVKVGTSAFTETDVNAYNATLPGAKSTSDVKTPAGKYYKVIKVVSGS